MAWSEKKGAFEMQSMAEEQPTADRLFDLGLHFATAGEAETDLVAAHMWLNLAAIRGNRAAAGYRQQIAREMTPTAVAAAQRAAREWLSAH